MDTQDIDKQIGSTAAGIDHTRSIGRDKAKIDIGKAAGRIAGADVIDIGKADGRIAGRIAGADVIDIGKADGRIAGRIAGADVIDIGKAMISHIDSPMIPQIDSIE